MCRLWLALERSFKHLLRRDVLAAIELDDAAIVKRVGITRENTLGSQARLRNREIRPRSRCDFRNLRILVYEDSKLIPRLSKPSSSKLLVRAFERNQSCRLILRWWSRWWRSRTRSHCSNRS